MIVIVMSAAKLEVLVEGEESKLDMPKHRPHVSDDRIHAMDSPMMPPGPDLDPAPHTPLPTDRTDMTQTTITTAPPLDAEDDLDADAVVSNNYGEFHVEVECEELLI